MRRDRDQPFPVLFLREAKSGRASPDMFPSSCDTTPGVCLRVCFCLKVLDEFVKLFDMREKTFVEALRAFLKEFRLPGEVSTMPRALFVREAGSGSLVLDDDGPQGAFVRTPGGTGA